MAASASPTPPSASARPMTVTRSAVVHADPLTVYRHVSDPTQTGRWSPENTGARLDDTGELRDATGGLREGSTFVGSNRRGPLRWVTRCRVTAARPGEEFTFRVEQIGVRTPRLRAPIATWSYRLRAVDGGTEVTEEWTDLRRSWSDRQARAFDFVATGGSTFARFNARNIEVTLRNLARELGNA